MIGEAMGFLFEFGDIKYALHHHRGTGTWLPGTVSAVLGSRSSFMKFSDGHESRCHVDHVRAHERGGDKPKKMNVEMIPLAVCSNFGDQKDEALMTIAQNLGQK